MSQKAENVKTNATPPKHTISIKATAAKSYKNENHIIQNARKITCTYVCILWEIKQREV